MVGMPTSRDTVCHNAEVLIPVIEELGQRVTVTVLDVHIKSFYELLHVKIGSYLIACVFHIGLCILDHPSST